MQNVEWISAKWKMYMKWNVQEAVIEIGKLNQ